MAASNTDPTVGAAVCASGSQVWKGHIGTLTANPRNIAPNTSQAKVPSKRKPLAINSGMSKVGLSPPAPDLKYSARKPRSMNAEPNRVKMKNLMAA